MTHEPTRPIFTAGKPTKADAWVEEKVEEHRKRLQAKAPTTYVWDIVSRLAIKKELEEECDYFRTALLAAHAHGEKAGEARGREEEHRKIDVGDNNYLTARSAVAELSGVPLMAITFDGHIKVIKDKLQALIPNPIPMTTPQSIDNMLPAHEASLHITHNQHKDYYEPIETYIQTREIGKDNDDWVTPTSKQRAIETDSLWELQWYPNTPVGFNVLYGATLEEILQVFNPTHR